MQETQEMLVQTPGQEDPLEEGMATHSSILAKRIPWTEEPAGLQSMGLQRVGHNGSDLAHMHTHTRFCLVMLSLRLSLVILFKIATPTSALPTLLLLHGTHRSETMKVWKHWG